MGEPPGGAKKPRKCLKIDKSNSGIIRFDRLLLGWFLLAEKPAGLVEAIHLVSGVWKFSQ